MRRDLKYNFGFTLVELLVVIAIIGILSSVAVVNLNSARTKAKTAAVKYNLAALTPAIILCHYDSKELTARFQLPAGNVYCTTNNAIPWVGHDICEGSDTTWPDITQNGFSYLECDSDPIANTWSLMAFSEESIIACNRNGCTEM